MRAAFAAYYDREIPGHRAADRIWGNPAHLPEARAHAPAERRGREAAALPFFPASRSGRSFAREPPASCPDGTGGSTPRNKAAALL
ncbi:hypothetical protein D3C80_1763810 [compost metagenome]